MSPAPPTRYALSGDAHIAYQVFGEGELDLVFVPGFVSNIEHYWEMPRVPDLLERLGSFARVAIFDKRGTGLSDPVAEPPPLEQRMDDMQAVMDAVGMERAALFGVSEGGPASVLFAATYPDRTSALVLYGSTPRFRTDSDISWGATDEVVELAIAATSARWGDGALLEAFAPSAANDPEMREVWSRFQRAGASPAMAGAVVAALYEIDVRDILHTIRVPTLILHRTGDLVASVEGARLMAEKIPDARLVEFEGDDHVPFTGDFNPVLDEMEEFLTGTRQARPLDRVLATVMFTDIVDSTRRAADAGDRGWRDLIERHDELTRRQLERFRGQEVKTLGDGFLATFDGPARAIECACAIRDGVGAHGLEVRAGLHTGECELYGDDVRGMAVNIGARVGALADANEVLVSSTVKDLVVGADLRFTERGEHELKGVPGRWRLYAAAAA
ncbi:MAG TPA: adenylate/guanylate cyclase domain-containing protein [Solirubrobacterales bacterium]|nr:adenylate/guanylate cyclase domain-containing protein [Solirubrobacterales bacterium]